MAGDIRIQMGPSTHIYALGEGQRKEGLALFLGASRLGKGY